MKSATANTCDTMGAIHCQRSWPGRPASSVVSAPGGTSWSRSSPLMTTMRPMTSAA